MNARVAAAAIALVPVAFAEAASPCGPRSGQASAQASAAHGAASGAAALPAREAAAADADDFRAIRAAEIAGDAALLDALARGADPETARRVELARTAIALRREARTVAAVRAAETSLCAERRAFAGAVAARDAACARELALESAEDLLLRALGADASDLLIAVGLPTGDERSRARALADDAAADIARARGTGAMPADAAFRADMLEGLADLVRAETGDDGRRAAAIALLARAAASQAPRPREIAALLAFARARASDGRDMQPAERLALLAEAQSTSDAATAFAARLASWRMRAGAEEPPAAPPALALLAATAEARAHMERGAAKDAGTALLRALAAASARGASPSESARLVQESGAQLAARLDAPLRAAACGEGAPAALFALGALADGEVDAGRARDARAQAAAREPLAAPWFAVPLARALERAGDSAGAASVLESCVGAVDGMPMARDLVELALAVRRAEARVSPAAAPALDAALATALRRLPDDPSAAAWMLERADLALFAAPDLARAESLLASFPRENSLAPLCALRRAELGALRALASPDAAEPLRAAAARFDGVDAGLDAVAPRVPRATIAEARARADAMRAALAEALRRPAEAATYAVRAVAAADATPDTRRRAGAIWLKAAAARTGDLTVPPEIAAFAREDEPLRRAVEPIALREGEETEALLIAGDARQARTRSESRLAPLVALATPTDGRATHALLRAAAVSALARGATRDAVAEARRALAAAPDEAAQRHADILLAEALRAEATEASRTEAFEAMRALSPLAAPARDLAWWRAQCGQLEMLAGDRARAASATARINRLRLLDPALGDPRIARRIEAVAKAMKEEDADGG